MRYLAVLCILGTALFPEAASAALVPVQCASPSDCGTCEFIQLINNVIQFIVVLATLAAVIVFVYAGFVLVTAQGNIAAWQRAKGYTTNVIIGLVLVLSAFLIIDTILAGFLPEGSPVFNWKTIECIYPRAPIQNIYEWEPGKAVDTAVTYYDDGTVYAGGGVCEVIPRGYRCSPENLERYFGEHAISASVMCNKESGGNPVWSSTDRCQDGRSFSGGWFQVNIFAHADKIPGCTGDFYEKVGSGIQGDCLEWKGSGERRYCAVRNCRITNEAVYNNCRRGVEDWDTNVGVASTLFRNKGNIWTDWRYSANLCRLPN